MVLIKAFLRKKKTKIYIKIFTIIITILFLLNGINEYVNYEFDKRDHPFSSIIMFAKENHEDILKKEKKVTTYRRALNFSIGVDNEIIYDPSLKINGTSVEYEELDETKILWSALQYKDTILAFSSSSCNTDLNDNEVILFLTEMDYNNEYMDNYRNYDITFRYKNQEITLLIKEILEPITFNYICISNALYNELIKEEQNYIYEIETDSYKTKEKLKERWNNIEDNDFFHIDLQTYDKNIDSSNKNNILEQMVKILTIANIISLIIFFIILLFVTNDFISDEKDNMILLKQLGYTKRQNRVNLLRNMLILDFIIFVLSIIISLLISIIINLVLKIHLEIFHFNYILSILIYFIVVEFIFSIFYIQNIENKQNQ